MISRILCSLFCLLCLSVPVCAAEEAVKPSEFHDAVLRKAISFMPADQRMKLTAVSKEMLAAMKPAESTEAKSEEGKSAETKPEENKPREIYYFIAKKEGPGPSALAEQFKLVTTGVNGKSTYPKLAPDLGRLAFYVLSLCQPYRTEDAVFGSPEHLEFEKSLNSAASSLKAEFDKFDKVNDPAEYAVKIAKQSNDLLAKLGTNKDGDVSTTRSAVFSLAANSIADCWWTLLVAKDDASQSQASKSSEYIGNKRSKKLHLPTCGHLPDEVNRVIFKTRDEAIKAGYDPCKICKP